MRVTSQARKFITSSSCYLKNLYLTRTKSARKIVIGTWYTLVVYMRGDRVVNSSFIIYLTIMSLRTPLYVVQLTAVWLVLFT